MLQRSALHINIEEDHLSVFFFFLIKDKLSPCQLRKKEEGKCI